MLPSVSVSILFFANPAAVCLTEEDWLSGSFQEEKPSSRMPSVTTALVLAGTWMDEGTGVDTTTSE